MKLTLEHFVSHSSKKHKYAVFLLIFFNVYFIAHIFMGRSSILTYRDLNAVKQKKELILNSIKNQNTECEREVALIRSKNIDADYLDELARSKLNYSFEQEKVIIYKK
jgi:cell division protein FtsB